jgi:DNA polymerase (family 10)
MAELLELHAENSFKIIAYSKAARAIESMKEDIEQLCKEGRLQSFQAWGRPSQRRSRSIFAPVRSRLTRIS